MSTKIDQAIQKGTSEVLELCEPKVMTPAEAVEYLEGVISNLEGSVEALKEENPELDQ